MKFFTPVEANKRLPLIKTIVTDILGKAGEARTLLAKPQDQDTHTKLMRIQEDIEALMRELEELGCFYKDWNFEIGLVDFPAVINGQEVLLCWRSDERSVRWYHGMEDGYPGRRLIPENLLE